MQINLDDIKCSKCSQPKHNPNKLLLRNSSIVSEESLKSKLTEFEEKMQKAKDEENDLLRIHKDLLLKQESMSEDYKPKWNFGFHRKCPLCGGNLKKIHLPQMTGGYYTSQDLLRSLFVCKGKCDYKYAHTEVPGHVD